VCGGNGECQGARGEEERTPGGGSARGFDDAKKSKNLKNSKKLANSASKTKTATKTINIDPKFAFYVEAARSRISSTSSNDEGISKTPKNTNKNELKFQLSASKNNNYQSKLNSDSIDSVESALGSKHSLQHNFQKNLQPNFEKISFQKRLFKSFNDSNNLTNNSTNNSTNNFNNNFTVKTYDHWTTIQINDIVLVEMDFESLQKGRETFNDFLDNCYDNDSVSKLVVYFNKAGLSSSLKTTFLTMDFGVVSSVKLSKMIGEQVLVGNCYMVMECSISTSDEDFSEDDADLIDFD